MKLRCPRCHHATVCRVLSTQLVPVILGVFCRVCGWVSPSQKPPVSEHVRHRCTDEHCVPCRGDLYQCDVCNGAEGDLPKECPGERMDADTREQVFAGKRNFLFGQWVRLEPAA